VTSAHIILEIYHTSKSNSKIKKETKYTNTVQIAAMIKTLV